MDTIDVMGAGETIIVIDTGEDTEEDGDIVEDSGIDGLVSEGIEGDIRKPLRGAIPYTFLW